MDLKATAVKGLKRAFQIFEQDLVALPEEAIDKCFGGNARTVADIVHEVNLVNDDVVRNMKGEPTMEWPEGWITAPENQRSKEAVLAAFRKSMSQAVETVEAFPEDSMEEPVQTEHGETTRFERCRFMGLHMFYHSGQLNFIQTLLGDSDWHWG